MEGADPNHGYEATLAGDSSSGGTQGGTDSSLQAGPKAGPVGNDPLIARHLCLDALQHLSHKGSNVGLACKRISLFRLHMLHSQDSCIDGNTKGAPRLRCIAVEAACSLKIPVSCMMHQGARTFHVHLVSYRRPQPYCQMQQQTCALLSR